MATRELPADLQQLAIKEINEEPKRIQEDLTAIKDWLSKQQHITARTDDQFLISFLRGCKFSLERTKEKLDTYYTFKTIIPELYSNRDPLDPEIQRILSVGLILPLPKLPYSTSPRYILNRFGLTEKHKFDAADVFKVQTMFQEILLMEDDNISVAGVVSLQDVSDVSLSHLISISPSIVKKSMVCLQQAYPFRMRGVHFFNISSFFEKLYALFKPFLTEKTKKRATIHKSFGEFCRNFPKEILPEEYGGQGGKLNDLTVYWKGKMESYRPWFLEDDKYKTNEKKRQGTPKTSETVFGLDGSFRRLSID